MPRRANCRPNSKSSHAQQILCSRFLRNYCRCHPYNRTTARASWQNFKGGKGWCLGLDPGGPRTGTPAVLRLSALNDRLSWDLSPTESTYCLCVPRAYRLASPDERSAWYVWAKQSQSWGDPPEGWEGDLRCCDQVAQRSGSPNPPGTRYQGP